MGDTRHGRPEFELMRENYYAAVDARNERGEAPRKPGLGYFSIERRAAFRFVR